MNRRPHSPADAYLIRHARRPNMIVVALKGAILIGGLLTLAIGMVIASANGTPPDFLTPALVCMPAGALLMVVGVWLVDRNVQSLRARDAGDNLPGDRTQPPPLPDRESDSA